MTLVVLIADGSAEAGLGHISRCSALAVALRQNGASVRTLGLCQERPLTRYGVAWEPAIQPDLAGAEAIVLDSYRATEALRARLASIAPLTAFADDDRAWAHAALVVRSGARRGSVGELAGLDYACLDPQYWSSRPNRLRQDVKEVLVATGAGDHTGAGPQLSESLRSTLPDCQVTLVRGPYASATDIPDGVRIVSAPESLFDALVSADLVMSAAGQTMLEALAVGTPCVALVTAENQRRQAAELQRIGALAAADTDEHAIAIAVALAADFPARRRQARIGRRVVDGRGAMRVADAVLELVGFRGGDNSTLGFRRADLADAGFLLALRNDPTTRRFSFTQDKIREREHIAWLTQRLSDPDSLIWIALDDGRPAGQLRLTRLDEETAEVHIAVAREFRNRGTARQMLASVVDLCTRSCFQVVRLRARIMPENKASLRAFRAAGFHDVEGSDQGGENVLERELVTTELN